jgi:hypothetical protein
MVKIPLGEDSGILTLKTKPLLLQPEESGYPGRVLRMQYHSTLAVPDFFFLRQVTKKL